MIRRILLIFCLLLLQPVQVFAYSYGDPNKEEFAETFKVIYSKMQTSPEDWNGAEEAFNSYKQEIALEFGNQVVQTLEANFAQKQKDLLLHNYKAVLVLNIDRRLTNADRQFDDYAKAKLLLAKGRGTFAILEPYVGNDTANKVYAAFDKALASLGNPGLFGVGTVPSNKAEYLKQAKSITALLHATYQIKAGSQTQSTPAKPKPVTAPAATKPVQETAQSNSSKVSNGTSTQTNNTATNNNATKSTATTPAAPTSSSTTATTTEAASTTTNSQPTANQTNAAATKAPTEATTDSSPEQSEQASPGDHQSSAPTASKVNPLVTVSVIGGLLVVIGTAFWIGKRKGLI